MNLSRNLRQYLQVIAIVMITIVSLQFAGANFGAHQLHLGDHQQENETHPHLQFTAEVVSFEQCVDCQCSADAIENEPNHQHLLSKTESVDFDLCLDCPCHGGHISLPSLVMVKLTIPDAVQPSNLGWHYLPPEHQPSYRPPIA